MFGPAKLPKDVVDRVARAVAAVVVQPDVRAQLERYAFDARSSSPEELGVYLKEQVDVWIRTARDVGIVPD